MVTTTITSSSSSRRTPGGAIWNRKVCVPISMPQTLLQDIDRARGDIARSPFVCKMLRARLNVGEEGVGKADGVS
jgi:hypothetical protein